MNHATDTASPPKKPLAMWIMQAVMIIAVALLLYYGPHLVSYARMNTPRGDGSAGTFVGTVVAGLLTWALAILFTAYKRMPVVRWLGGAFIVVLMILAAAMLTDVPDSVKSGDQYRIGWRAMSIAGIGLSAYWLFAFAFSADARRYLGVR